MIFVAVLFLFAVALCLIPYLIAISKEGANKKEITKKYLYKNIPITMVVILILFYIGENGK